MSLNDLVCNTGHALNSNLTKWKLFGDLKKTPQCPQKALPNENFKYILPTTTDTDNDGCISVDEFEQELENMYNERFSELRKSRYICHSFDLKTAMMLTESVFHEMPKVVEKAQKVFFKDDIPPHAINNWANLTSTILEAKLRMAKLSPTGGGGVGVDVNERTGKIISVQKGSSADRAGLLAGDVIVKIDGWLYKLLPSPANLELIGPCGTDVKLLIYRPLSFFGLDIFKLGMMLYPEGVQKNFGYQEISLTRDAYQS